MNQLICTMQIGKNRLTQEFIESVKTAFSTHENIKVSVLKSAAKEKKEIGRMASEMQSALGSKFTYRIVGHTIFLKKWRKPHKQKIAA